MTKPANFPARKAQRQREAAERRIPQIKATLKGSADNHQDLKRELVTLEAHAIMLVSPFCEVRTKKNRGNRVSF